MPAKRNTVGWIYLIHCLDRQVSDGIIVKLGWSKSPLSRLKLMQWGNPHQLIIIGMYRATPGDEGEYHRKLKKYRLRGEWYNLNARQLDTLTKRLIANADNYEEEPKYMAKVAYGD